MSECDHKVEARPGHYHNHFIMECTKCGESFNINDILTKQHAQHEKLESLTDILENLLHWDTCPDDYKDRIAAALGKEEELSTIRSKEYDRRGSRAEVLLARGCEPHHVRGTYDEVLREIRRNQ